MTDRVQCEFSLIRYVPDVVKGEFTNIGVVLRETGAKGGAVRFTRDWSRVRCLDPDADTALLESLETELAERLLRDQAERLLGDQAERLLRDQAEQLQGGVDARRNARPVLETLQDSLSNSLQLTEMRGTLAESLAAEMELLLRMYVEPLKAPRGARVASGRGRIVLAMRKEFERAGVWALMQKRIAAAQYTQPGDPLKIDCGYRNGQVRLFQAVSLDNEVEGAKGLAYSAAALRAGVQRSEGVTAELTAIIQPVSAVKDVELYRFGVSVMEREAIRVLTVADLERVAETARRELRV